jgi:hypothetical protein
MSCSRAELLKTAHDLAERLHNSSITTIKGVVETIVKDIAQLEERVDELEEMRPPPPPPAPHSPIQPHPYFRDNVN